MNPINLRINPMHKKCGAKTRAGQPCKNWPIKNKKRCRMHGGKSTGPPKGNQNARTHGAYSRGILDSERELYDLIKTGTLDEEIKICSLLLARTAQAQKKFEEANERRASKGIEIEDLDIDQLEGMLDSKLCKKYETLMTLAIRLSGRIGDLEAVRAELIRGKS